LFYRVKIAYMSFFSITFEIRYVKNNIISTIIALKKTLYTQFFVLLIFKKIYTLISNVAMSVIYFYIDKLT